LGRIIPFWYDFFRRGEGGERGERGRPEEKDGRSPAATAGGSETVRGADTDLGTNNGERLTIRCRPG